MFSVICMHQGSESNAISILYVCTVHVAELTKQTLTFFDFDTGSVTIITVYKVITIERYNITTYILFVYVTYLDKHLNFKHHILALKPVLFFCYRKGPCTEMCLTQ